MPVFFSSWRRIKKCRKNVQYPVRVSLETRNSILASIFMSIVCPLCGFAKAKVARIYCHSASVRRPPTLLRIKSFIRFVRMFTKYGERKNFTRRISDKEVTFRRPTRRRFSFFALSSRPHFQLIAILRRVTSSHA